MNALGGIHHIALWPAPVDTPTDTKRITRLLNERGFHVSVLDPRRGSTRHDADLAVGLGDPVPAAHHAHHARIPLLIAESAQRAVAILTGDLSALTTRRHYLVQLRADRSRVRTVLAEAHINVSAPGSVVHVQDRHHTHSGLSARIVTADPLHIGDSSTPRPDRPVLRVERSSGIWSESIPLHRHKSVIVTPRPAGKLHIVTDGGRHAGLADALELGPIVPVVIVDTPA